MIALIGAGFLGSLFAEEVAKRFFAGERPGMLRVIDFDDVDARNCANQNFTPRDIGRPKAEVIAERWEMYGLRGEPRIERLTEANKDTLLEGVELLVSATDNMDARNLAWYHAAAAKIPLLHLGVSQRGTGAVEWTVWDEYDSWTLSPMALRGKQAPPPAIEPLRPCELVGFRGLGLNCAVAGAKALNIFLGFDPEHIVTEPGELPAGPTFTTWTVFNDGHTLQDTFVLQLQEG